MGAEKTVHILGLLVKERVRTYSFHHRALNIVVYGIVVLVH